jgi:hypothetical protein
VDSPGANATAVPLIFVGSHFCRCRSEATKQSILPDRDALVPRARDDNRECDLSASDMPSFKTVVIAGVFAAVIAIGWWLFARKSADEAAGLGYEAIPIGAPVSEFGQPWVTHLKIVDLDQDTLLDVLYCDAKNNSVRWIRQSPRGTYVERVLANQIKGPAHVDTADLYGRGRLDVLIASMGQIAPTAEPIGSVVILENLANGGFQKHVLLEGVSRVTDLRAANISGHADGRLDLIVGQFGYVQGEVSWMKNLGDWNFDRQVLLSKPGAIHTPLADYDGDGQLDFAALVAQDSEAVHLFRQERAGEFKESLIWRSTNQDFGSSGMSVADVNRDGKPDLLVTNGDGLDFPGADQRPWHGLQWLENLGAGKFKYHRIGDLPGCFSPSGVDLDSDGDIDLLTVSAFGEWSDEDSISMMAWVNDGQNKFTPIPLAKKPIRLITSDVGDLDGNGVPVIVTGGFFPWPPYRDMSNITLWRRKK